MSKQSYWEKPLNSSLASLMMVSLCATTSLYPIIGSAEDDPPPVESVCYGIADNDRYNGSKDELAKVQVGGGFALGVVGPVINTETSAQTLQIEATTFNNTGSTLYAMDEGLFGTLNISSLSPAPIDIDFDPIGQVGVCDGPEGPISFNDVDGLTYDFATHKFFGTQRREHQTPQKNDLLFQVDYMTGQCIKGAFNGDDYVVITVNGCSDCYDVDDIAADPGPDADLYIIANKGDGVAGALAILERDNGMPTGVANLVGWNQVDDIESLDFDKQPKVAGAVPLEYELFGTTGNGGLNKSDLTSNSIYVISGVGAASSSPVKIGPTTKNPPQDYEAVACRVEGGFIPPTGDPACLLYAMHDEGQFHSQLVEINPLTGAIRAIGDLHKRKDIEGLLMVDGELYGTSGSDQAPGIPNGAIYKIDRFGNDPQMDEIGETCYGEISSMALRSDGTVWAWARGGTLRAPIAQRTATGPITLDLDVTSGTACANGKNGIEELATLYEEFPYHFGRKVQGLAWGNRNGEEVLYLVNGRGDLYYYDPDGVTNALDERVELACENVLGRKPEAMESQANGLLLFSVHGRKDIGIVAYDPINCEEKSSRKFTNVPYDDIEAIEWPQQECQNASYLYANSGEAELELTEVNQMTEEQAATIAEGLNAVLERQGDLMIGYVNGEAKFVAQIVPTTTPRAARKAGDNCISLGEGLEGCPTFYVGEAVAKRELEKLPTVENVEFVNGGIEITTTNGSTLSMEPAFEVTVTYGEGPLEEPYELDSLEETASGDKGGDKEGKEGYEMTFKSGTVVTVKQNIYFTGN